VLDSIARALLKQLRREAGRSGAWKRIEKMRIKRFNAKEIEHFFLGMLVALQRFTAEPIHRDVDLSFIEVK